MKDENATSSDLNAFSPSMPAQSRALRMAAVPSRWIRILAVVVLFLCGSVAVAFLPFVSIRIFHRPTVVDLCGEPETFDWQYV